MNLQMIQPIKKNNTFGSIKWYVYFHHLTRVLLPIDACVIFTSSSNALYQALLAYSKKWKIVLLIDVFLLLFLLKSLLNCIL